MLGDLPRAADVNARPTTSIIGITRVMREEIGRLLLRASFGGCRRRCTWKGSLRSRKRISSEWSPKYYMS